MTNRGAGHAMRYLGVMLPSLYVKRPSYYFYPTLLHFNLEQKLRPNIALWSPVILSSKSYYINRNLSKSTVPIVERQKKYDGFHRKVGLHLVDRAI